MPRHDIRRALSALPIFISSCEEMLVLLGETFPSRLWYLAGARDGHGTASLLPFIVWSFTHTATLHTPSASVMMRDPH